MMMNAEMARREARLEGYTHKATLFGVPVFIRFDGTIERMANVHVAPRWQMTVPLLTAFMVTIPVLRRIVGLSDPENFTLRKVSRI